jgi:hypothetical protein
MIDAATLCLVPSSDFCAQTLARLPLADAVLHLLRHVFDADFLNGLYAQHRGQGYEDLLAFPRLVELLSDALLVHGGSARRALLDAQRRAQLPVCKEAFYGKLRRLPLPLSVAFLTQASERLRPLLPPVDSPLPQTLQRYDVLLIDGKKTKHVAKRLKLTRDCAGQLLGAKLLVGFDPVTRLIRNVAAHPDGERNDSPLVPDLLAGLAPTTPRRRLLVSDAQFCDLVQISRYRTAGNHFVLRYHPKLHFHPDPQRPATTCTDARGRRLTEEHGWLGAARDPRRCYVRRVTWSRTDHKDLSIVTDLLGGATEAVPATDLIDGYLIRWRIETVFQDVTVVFGLKKLIGSTAEATAFQAAWCMVAYNALQVVRAYIAVGQAQPLPVDDVSGTMLFESLRQELSAVLTVLPAEALAAALPQVAVAEYLRQRLSGVWQPIWRKARNKKPRVYGAKPKGSGAHTSVDRVVQEHKQKPRSVASGG